MPSRTKRHQKSKNSWNDMISYMSKSAAPHFYFFYFRANRKFLWRNLISRKTPQKHKLTLEYGLSKTSWQFSIQFSPYRIQATKHIFSNFSKLFKLFLNRIVRVFMNYNEWLCIRSIEGYGLLKSNLRPILASWNHSFSKLIARKNEKLFNGYYEFCFIRIEFVCCLFRRGIEKYICSHSQSKKIIVSPLFDFV